MIFSKACNYGLRAALYIATKNDRQFLPIKEISEELEISFHFLTKILQTLTQKGILVSGKGPKGGVALARPAESVSLLEIIDIIDGSQVFQNCLIGLDVCDNDHPCPMHEKWRRIREQLQKVFKETSLADLAREAKTSGFRLSVKGNITN